MSSDKYDPTSDKKFSGGDLVGVSDKLGYIEDLGATSIWITPPVANQWWDAEQNYGGYHGCWVCDFQKVDEHFGDMESYQALAREVHARNMFLIQDIVTNHVGNFCTYDDPYNYDPSLPCQGFRLIGNALPAGQELPYPLNINECKEDGTGIYHWTPSITDHNDPVQEKTWQLSDLDDLNTSDPEVRAYLSMGGPNGNYSLPTDPTFDKDNSQLAINKAEVFTVGSNVRLTFTMDKISDTWLPPNGFDHVGFTIFIDLPEEAATNLTELPKINASMPSGTWSHNAVVFGWQSSIYNTQGANATTWGEAVTPAPMVKIDKANNTISMDFASDALGRPDSLDGIRFYVTTWDLDGLSATYRPLEQDKGPWNFSGGASDESKIWDDLPIITLSE